MSLTQYTPPPTVARFMRSNAPFRMINGPVGSGKSTGCIMEIARRATMQEPSRDGIRRTRWAVIRNTKQQLKDTTLKTWLEWFPHGAAGTWKETDMTFTMRFGDVHAEVMFRALDDPDDVKRLLSLELTGAYLNESREIPIEIVIALRSRVGRYPSRKEVAPTWSGVLGDTNPPDMDSWIFEKFETEKLEGWEIFKQPGGLDPGAENRDNLPPNYYEDMMVGASQDWIDVHVHAKYGRSKAGRPVYDRVFNHDTHTTTDLRPITSLPIIIGMDFGRTPAATFEQRVMGGQQLVLDEVWAENTGLERFLQQHVMPKLASRFPGMRTIVCGDPAGWDKSQINDKSCYDILTEHKFRAIKAPTNLIDRRIEAVERQLTRMVDGKPGLLIDRDRCPRLVQAFNGSYMYKKQKSGGYSLTPDKNDFSHISDARQYAALCSDYAGDMAGGQVALQAIQVVSSKGWT